MTATPHNGKEEDFQLFMALLDADRFEGRDRDGVHTVDASDLMRRLVKEQLLKFDGTPLFPERRAYTVGYKLSDAEAALYKSVTDYVRDEFNRADALENEGRKGTVGFALTILQRRLASSPEAILQSLRRRRERLERRLREEQLLKRGGEREAGTLYTYDPRRLSGVSVHREAEREFSQGDRVQFTAPSRELHVANRDLATVEHVNSNGDLRIRMDSGQEVRFNVREHPHLDYGYAVTSHSSQGQTADRVLIHVDTEKSELLVNNRFAYVSVSRAQNDAHIYTNDAGKLGRSLSRESSQRTATEVEQHPNAPKAEPGLVPAVRPSEEDQSHGLGMGIT
jgi:hypothetical protein